MAKYILVAGTVFTDEEIDRECAEHETGAWEGHLEDVNIGRTPAADGPRSTDHQDGKVDRCHPEK
jgi:hypothetical protein